MKNIRALLILALLTVIPIFVRAQVLVVRPEAVAVDSGKLDSLAVAIASAEGFGVRHAIPTRYHNPGDLKTSRKFKWDGQKGIGKGGHVIFKSDAEGWAALKQQILKAASGRSKAYNPSMTFQQIGKKYAGNWRTWSKNVCKQLDVPTTTTLRAYLAPVEPEAPVVIVDSQLSMPVLPEPSTSMPTLADDQLPLNGGIKALSVGQQRLLDSMMLDQMYQEDQQNPQRWTLLI